MKQNTPNILCIALTPALDHYVTVKEFGIGEINRSIEVIERAGGKSINSARAMRTLGGNPVIVTALGGNRGKAIAEYAKNEGFNLSFIETAEETRQYTEIWDETNLISTHISEQWSKISKLEWLNYCNEIVETDQWEFSI